MTLKAETEARKPLKITALTRLIVRVSVSFDWFVAQ